MHIISHHMTFIITDLHHHPTHHIEPILVDGFTSTVPGELDTEFATFRVSRIFPLWSNTLLEEVIVGIGLEMVHFSNVVVNAI